MAGADDQGAGAARARPSPSPARRPFLMHMGVAAAIAVPLTIIISANLPNGILSGVSIGYSTAGGWVSASPPPAEESMQKQVRMLQEQMDNLMAMRPGPEASGAEQQRWQEMRKLLSRQVELVVETLQDRQQDAAAEQEAAAVPHPADQEREAPAAAAVEAGEPQQPQQEKAHPLVAADKQLLRAARARRRNRRISKSRHQHAAPDPDPGAAEAPAISGRPPPKSYMQPGAVGIPLKRLMPPPPPPPPPPLNEHRKPAGVQEFALVEPDPRYRVPPKAPKLASLPNHNGTWRACFEAKKQCRACTLGPGDPNAEPCVVCTECPMTLSWPDSHPRVNPTLSAKLKARKDAVDAFVKFPCIPTDHSLPAALRVDPHRRCQQGTVEQDFAAPARHVVSIQRITDDCGLDGIAARYWVDNAMTVIDDGPFVYQRGVFAQTAPGTSIERLSGPNRRLRIRSIPVQQILQATLHDFILCEGDRHQGNIYIDNDNNIMLIDNDRALGNKASMTREMAHQTNRKCQPSSLFLPMTMESNRLNEGPLAYLDYRCHTGEAKDLFLPPKVRQCLVAFAHMSPEKLQAKYDILFLQWAEDLRDRARDILELGFWQALNRSLEHSKSEYYRLESQRPGPGHQNFLHWRGAFWRPLKPENCNA